ncbi:MAG: adenylate/guanylate cyclase domain-containing protein, partial [Thiotrichales bacterium]|nr:adenylate/guanylate cyclase domain-containing protein [Thiotrichales bacterium]
MHRLIERLKKQLPLVILEVVLLVLFLAHVLADKGQLLHWKLIEQLENIAYDARILASTPGTVDDRIVIVDIDEKSLAEIGRWPWGRDKLARVIDQLFTHYNVEVVGFDVVFAEPDDSSGLSVLERLSQDEFRNIPEFRTGLDKIRDSLDYDQLFVDSLQGKAVILGYFFESTDDALTTGMLPPPILSAKEFSSRDFRPHKTTGFGANLEDLTRAAHGAGHFTLVPDDDGIVRRVPMLFEYEGNYYESLTLAMLRYLFKSETIDFKYGWTFSGTDYSAPERIKVSDREIPIDEKSQVLVPYLGKQGSFPYIPIVDVINGTVEKKVLHDRIVLIGTSAQGLLDLRATPVQSAYPGVEVHANILSGVLDNRIKERSYFVLGAEFSLLLIIGLLMALVMPGCSPQVATGITGGLLLFSIGANYLIWEYMNLVIPIASGVLMIFIMFLLNMSYGFFVEQRGKRQIAGLFGQYVPPELVDEMSEDPTHYSLDAEVRELTVLFSDIRSFTTISENMDAQSLSDLLNEYLTPMTNIIQKSRGTIDKYIGDAVMAFWGAPIRQPDHARLAIAAAMEMLKVLPDMNKTFKARGWPELRIGIGLNTGKMRVGDMGSEFRKAYTVMGDAVNLGSRLEGQTKGYGVELLVSETTKAGAPDYAYRELDRIRV